MRKLITLLILVLSFAVQAEESMARFGATAAPLTEMPAFFRVIDWNVHKGADRQLFADFARIGREAHLALFQEAVENQAWIEGIVRSQPAFKWSMARSFYSQRESDFHGYTGVATGSQVQSVREVALKSPVTEPISNTAKTVIVSEFRLQGSPSHLLVVNVHAINFVLESAFEKHLNQILDVVRRHQGPVIIAGDFNTWSDTRVWFLKKSMQKLGISRVEIGNYYWLPVIYPYDHVFARGLKVHQAAVLDFIDSSDHKPLVIDFEVQKPSVLNAGAKN